MVEGSGRSEGDSKRGMFRLHHDKWPAHNYYSQKENQEADIDLLNHVDPNQQEDLRAE